MLSSNKSVLEELTKQRSLMTHVSKNFIVFVRVPYESYTFIPGVEFLYIYYLGGDLGNCLNTLLFLLPMFQVFGETKIKFMKCCYLYEA